MIRTIGPEEWPVWRELRLRALTDAPTAFRATIDEESTRPDDWWTELIGATAEHPRGGLWVAWSEGEAVGMLFGRIDKDHTVLEIGAMWVAPAVRRLGVGSGLIRAVIEWARGLGVSVASLWVTEENVEAVAFYERHGFQPTETTDVLRPRSHLIVREVGDSHRTVVTLCGQIENPPKAILHRPAIVAKKARFIVRAISAQIRRVIPKREIWQWTFSRCNHRAD